VPLHSWNKKQFVVLRVIRIATYNIATVSVKDYKKDVLRINVMNLENLHFTKRAFFIHNIHVSNQLFLLLNNTQFMGDVVQAFF